MVNYFLSYPLFSSVTYKLPQKLPLRPAVHYKGYQIQVFTPERHDKHDCSFKWKFPWDTSIPVVALDD